MLVYEEIEESTMEKNALSARRVANLLTQIQRIKRWSADENMADALYFKRAIESALDQKTMLGIHSDARDVIWQAARLLDPFEFQDAEFGRYDPEKVRELVASAAEMGRSLRQWRERQQALKLRR